MSCESMFSGPVEIIKIKITLEIEYPIYGQNC